MMASDLQRGLPRTAVGRGRLWILSYMKLSVRLNGEIFALSVTEDFVTCDEAILQQNDYFWPCTNRFHIAVGGEHSGTKSIFSLHFLPHVNRLQYTLVFTDDSRISVKSVHMFTCVSHICRRSPVNFLLQRRVSKLPLMQINLK